MIMTSPCRLTTDDIEELSQALVEFNIDEEIKSIAFAFAAQIKELYIDITEEIINCSDYSVFAESYLEEVRNWDKKSIYSCSAKEQLDALMEKMSDDIFHATTPAEKEKLRRKKRRKANQAKKAQEYFAKQIWRIEYIRLYSFVDTIMKDCFINKKGIKEEYFRQFYRYDDDDEMRKASINAARVKSRVATIEEPKVIERKRLLGFAIFLLINAAVNKQKICENTVVHATWTWWLKNPKIKKSFDGKKVEMCNLKRRYFPNKKIEKQQWSDDGPDIIVQKGGLKNAPLFRFISRGLQSKDEDLVSAIKDLLNNFKKYTDRNANTIPFSQAVKLHDAAEAFYVKKSQPRFSCSFGGRKGLAKSIPSE